MRGCVDGGAPSRVGRLGISGSLASRLTGILVPLPCASRKLPPLVCPACAGLVQRTRAEGRCACTAGWAGADGIGRRGRAETDRLAAVSAARSLGCGRERGAQHALHVRIAEHAAPAQHSCQQPRVKGVGKRRASPPLRKWVCAWGGCGGCVWGWVEIGGGRCFTLTESHMHAPHRQSQWKSEWCARARVCIVRAGGSDPTCIRCTRISSRKSSHDQLCQAPQPRPPSPTSTRPPSPARPLCCRLGFGWI